ncbi:MAG: tetratricopeptide repeat protein, partial [Spirochaetaceae bacterium]|nr:tetratricopeptide repeat protein [Spirochaetaceae bacterium]
MFFVVTYLVAPQQIAVLPKWLQEGNAHRVIKAAQAMIAKDPQNVEAHYYLGMAYLAQENTPKALEELSLVSQLGVIGRAIPEIAFRQTIAQLFVSCNQPEEALKEYLLLIQLDPENEEFYYQAGKLFFRRNQVATAKQYFYKASKLNPENTWVHGELGYLLYTEQKTVEAKQELEKATNSSTYNGQ